METELLLERLRSLWLEVVAPNVRKNCCILAASTTVRVCQYFGVRAKELAVRTRILNTEAVELEAAHVPMSEWPDSAWSVGVNESAPPVDRGWVGHLMVSVENGDFIVDLSSYQWDRPSKGIEVGALIRARADITTSTTGWSVAAGASETTWCMWQPWPENRGYRKGKDWRAGAEHITGPLIRQLRADVVRYANDHAVPTVVIWPEGVDR
jgi:hypothetical protein